MAKGHANVQRQHKLHAIGRSPQLQHGRQIVLDVARVLGHPVAHPVDGIPAVAPHRFLDGVVGGKVQERQVDGDIKQDHLGGVQHAVFVLYFFRKGHLGKLVHGGEPLAVLVDHEVPLETAEIGKAKEHKNAVAPPVDFRQGFSLGDHLHNEIGGGGFARRHHELKDKGVVLGKGENAAAHGAGRRRWLAGSLQLVNGGLEVAALHEFAVGALRRRSRGCRRKGRRGHGSSVQAQHGDGEDPEKSLFRAA